MAAPAGEGLIDFQTAVAGTGRVVLNTTGPVEDIALHCGRIAAEGKQIIARTAGLTYAVRRPSVRSSATIFPASALCAPTAGLARCF